jgi:hypothetical protein
MLFTVGCQWLESEVRTPGGGVLFGRASDVSGNIEGIHDQVGSPAALLIDEAKIIKGEIIDTLERCYDVSVIHEFDRPCERRFLPDHDGEGASVADVQSIERHVSTCERG